MDQFVKNGYKTAIQDDVDDPQMTDTMDTMVYPVKLVKLSHANASTAQECCMIYIGYGLR